MSETLNEKARAELLLELAESDEDVAEVEELAAATEYEPGRGFYFPKADGR